MSRDVEAAATSRVLKVRTRFISRIGMRYSMNALDGLHHSHTCTETTTASSFFFVVIQLLQLRYRF
jgi:hypothetical protein